MMQFLFDKERNLKKNYLKYIIKRNIDQNNNNNKNERNLEVINALSKKYLET